MLIRFKTALVAVILAACAGSIWASGGDAHPLDKFPVQKMSEVGALQRGAKMFVNYCLNCHSASSMRYNRLQDIGLSEAEIKEHLLFTGEKVGDLMKVSMSPADAKSWFGAQPPDLSVIARARASHAGSGADWLYTYLRSYYVDDSRPTGWNNHVFPNVGMPHIFWELQGKRDSKGQTMVQGTMSNDEFDSAIGDLVAFLVYMGEPAQQTRQKLGVVVLMFLSVFFGVAWFLNKAYWKDIK